MEADTEKSSEGESTRRRKREKRDPVCVGIDQASPALCRGMLFEIRNPDTKCGAIRSGSRPR